MKKILAGLLAISLLMSSLFAGCANTVHEETEGTVNAMETSKMEATAAVSETTAAPTTVPTETATEPPTEQTEPATELPVQTEPEELLTEEQQNSINMLNFLTALVTEINASSSSRVYLESVYDELRNNTNPSVVDGATRIEYENILDLLFKYRMIEVKRERLQYIYDQNSAAALQSALPSPLSLMNVVRSRNGLKTVVSLLFLAMDSASSYKNYTNEIEMQYLQDSWVLEDEEAANLHNSRKSMFSYMVKIVNTYGLPDDMTLNEASVTELIKWKNHNNIDQRLLFLESNQQTYSAYGDYWLILTENYYLDNQYGKCLAAVEQYQTLKNGIFRRDYRFANVIPYAIVAAKATMGSEAYVEFADEYISLLLANTDQNNWTMRYFAAQTYVELYGKTKDKTYLQKAYDVALQTMNYLVEEQKALNTEYIADIVKAEIPKDATSEEKKTIRKYNSYLEDERAVALPPVYEPLRLYCDFLFALAGKMNLSWSAKKNVDSILHGQGALFLDETLDGMYWMTLSNAVDAKNVEVTFDGNSFSIPAKYVSAISSISVFVNGQPVTDWVIKKVDRNKSSDVEAFVATYTSETAKDIKYSEGDMITLKIQAFDGEVAELSFSFVVEKTYVAKIAVATKFTRV